MLRFLALGDSYTIGEGVAEAERWPMQLRARLAAHGIELAPPEIVARTGWTSDELEQGIEAAAPGPTPYDLVSLLVGVNNQYRGLAAEEFRSGFRALLRRAVDFAGGRPQRVLVLSIPDWGKTPFAEGRDRAQIEAAIAAFNQICQQEAQAQSAHWIFVTDESPLEPGSARLAPDGLHPSGLEYTRWAELVLDPARQALAG